MNRGNITKEIEEYIKWLSHNATEAHRIYPVWLNRLDKHLGKNLEELTLGDVKSFISKIHQYRPPHLKKYSEASINNCRVILRSFFIYLSRRGYKTINPYKIGIKRVEPKVDAINLEQYKELLRSLTLNSLTHRQAVKFKSQSEIIIRLLWETGARVGEICKIRLRDIELRNRCAYIESGRNKHRRWLVWSNETNLLLKKYLDGSEKIRDLDYVFDTSARRVQRMIKSLVKEAGIANDRKITPQSFRIRVSEDMKERGHDISFIRYFLGNRRSEIWDPNKPRPKFSDFEIVYGSGR